MIHGLSRSLEEGDKGWRKEEAKRKRSSGAHLHHRKMPQMKCSHAFFMAVWIRALEPAEDVTARTPRASRQH